MPCARMFPPQNMEKVNFEQSIVKNSQYFLGVNEGIKMCRFNEKVHGVSYISIMFGHFFQKCRGNNGGSWGTFMLLEVGVEPTIFFEQNWKSGN